MIRFITEHRDRFGVELICRVLRSAVQGFLTSRGYRAAVTGHFKTERVSFTERGIGWADRKWKRVRGG